MSSGRAGGRRVQGEAVVAELDIVAAIFGGPVGNTLRTVCLWWALAGVLS